MATQLATQSKALGGGLALRIAQTTSFFENPFVLWLSAMLGFLSLLFIGVSEHSLLSTLVIGSALLLIGFLLLALERNHTGTVHLLLKQFVVAYGFRIFAALLMHLVMMQFYSVPWQYSDESGFCCSRSEYVLRAWQTGTILRLNPIWSDTVIWAWLQVVGFTRFLGSLLGADTFFNLRLLNSFAGALLVPYVFKLANRLFDPQVAKTAAMLAFLLPDYLYYSTTILRDVFVSLVLCIIFYQMVEFNLGKSNLWRLVLALALNFGFIHFSRYMLSLVVMGIIMLCWVRTSISSFSGWRRLKQITLLAVLSGSVFIVLRQFIPVDSALSLQRLLDPAHLASTASGYTERTLNLASYDSLGAKILTLPGYARVTLSTAHVLLTPFPPWGPFQQGGFQSLDSLMESLVGIIWYMIVPWLVLGLWDSFWRRNQETVWVWLPTAVFLLMLGSGTGAVIRWRLMVMPFMLILIAHGMAVANRYRPGLFLIRLGLFGLLILYMVIKYLSPSLGLVYSFALLAGIGLLVFLAASMHKRT